MGSETRMEGEYTNWRGETRWRTFTPERLWWGSNEWHPEPQWLLTATDAETGECRDFALVGFTTPLRPAGTTTGPTFDEVWGAGRDAEQKSSTELIDEMRDNWRCASAPPGEEPGDG